MRCFYFAILWYDKVNAIIREECNMIDFEINFPSIAHKEYIEKVYEFCKDNGLSMILKGSLANGKATKFSDIDLIVLGNMDAIKVDELITLYGKPVMTNITENPKGILIIIYEKSLSIDLDIRETISKEDLEDSKVILKNDRNFSISNNEAIRKQIKSPHLPDRPNWYKVLRLIHKGTIKYLTNKTDSAYIFLEEIKESLMSLKISDLSYNNNFEDDIICIFNRFCKEFEVDYQVKNLFYSLFKQF